MQVCLLTLSLVWLCLVLMDYFIYVSILLTLVSSHVPVQVQSGECNLLGLQHWSERLSGSDHRLVQRVDEKLHKQQVCSYCMLTIHS